MIFTHWVYGGKLRETPDLSTLQCSLAGSEIRHRPIVFCLWRIKQHGTLMVYKSGKVAIHGDHVDYFKEALEALDLHLESVRLLTRSAKYQLKSRVDYPRLVRDFGGFYESELNNTAIIKRDGVALLVHHNGAVCITGLTNDDRIDTALSLLLEIEL